MVGISLNNMVDKKLLIETNDIIIPIKGEEDDEFLSKITDVDRRQSSFLFRFVMILFVIGCLITSYWFFLEFASQINHKWNCTCHLQGKLMNGGLIPLTTEKQQVLLSSTVKQQIGTTPKRNVTILDIPQMGITTSARIITNYDYNVTIIRDDGLMTCFLVAFDFHLINKPFSLVGILWDFLQGLSNPYYSILPSTAKVQMPPLTAAELAIYGPEVLDSCPIEMKTFRIVPKTWEEIYGSSKPSV